jgi:hypothetical protein
MAKLNRLCCHRVWYQIGGKCQEMRHVELFLFISRSLLTDIYDSKTGDLWRKHFKYNTFFSHSNEILLTITFVYNCRL